MNEITKEQCEKLYEDYVHFSVKSGFAYGFIFHTAIGVKIKDTIVKYDKTSQEELRSMFRTVLKLMGKDYSDYEETCGKNVN